MFKDDSNVATNNIYNSFKKVLDKHGACDGLIYGLDELCVEDLSHLKWLIEQQINILQTRIKP